MIFAGKYILRIYIYYLVLVCLVLLEYSVVFYTVVLDLICCCFSLSLVCI